MNQMGSPIQGTPKVTRKVTKIEKPAFNTLKNVEGGADFVITQLFYDVQVYVDCVKECRAADISVPIIPGIMPIQNYSGIPADDLLLQDIVPLEVVEDLELIKDNDEAVKGAHPDDVMRKLGIRALVRTHRHVAHRADFKFYILYRRRYVSGELN
ncbi:hypothetical protein PsorP6_000969 [Peronosclerospora sorghi]|uniref:Uncharacterized protein n=1 Tax=Peronosclerospora sorghi TaxID=230839 RepID=A0ACC0WSE4_9STRA|nr:hypothetical protein PsorP6_000969 [Peronosclerospora sorghi]